MNPDLNSFLQAWSGGDQIPESERQRLLRKLQDDPDFRAECAQEIRLLGMIKAVQNPPPRWLDLNEALGLTDDSPGLVSSGELAQKVMDRVRQETPGRVKFRSRWLQWRPLTAAAAGLVFGVFCTSMAWAVVGPYAGKAITLLQQSFESGPAPLTTGIPLEPGLWNGDFSEIVTAQQGVQPARGTKMLRFLRADYDRKPDADRSYIADVYQLIDLRPYRQAFADGGAVVQLSAAFNAFKFPESEHYDCSVAIHALDAQTALNGSSGIGKTLDTDCLAIALNSRMELDRLPATWQRSSAELRLPPATEFLLIRIGVAHNTKAQRRTTFDGHFLDEVRLTLARRAPLPG